VTDDSRPSEEGVGDRIYVGIIGLIFGAMGVAIAGTFAFVVIMGCYYFVREIWGLLP